MALWRSLGRAAPAYSPRKAWQSQYACAKMLLRFAADSVLRSSRPFVPRRDRRQKTHKPALYPSALRRVKRTHAANQMKRVQRVEDSLAQSGARNPSVLPAESMAKPICSRKNALCRAADSVPHLFRSPAFPRPFVLRRDRHKETRKPEMSLPSPITTRHPRTREWRSRPTAE